MDITRPSENEIVKYLKLWDSFENYVLQERSLRKLFLETYPNNKEIDDVLIKVSCLNDFYSTNIFSPFSVAKHIVDLNIDERLKDGDLSLVNEIAKVKMSGGKMKNFYSFATKYCSHHRPEIYPIYDSYVEKVLLYFKKKDAFFDFKSEDLKQYEKFKNVLVKFSDYYGLESHGLREIDQYLWQIGKEYFPKKY